MTEIPKIVVPRPISAFPRSKIQLFIFSPNFAPRLFFQAVPCARIARAIFVRELPRGGVNFPPRAILLENTVIHICICKTTGISAAPAPETRNGGKIEGFFILLNFFKRIARAGKRQNPPGQFSHTNRPGNSRTRNRLEKTVWAKNLAKNEKLNFRFWEGRNRPRDCDFRNLRQKL